jgi:hypothetical protein
MKRRVCGRLPIPLSEQDSSEQAHQSCAELSRPSVSIALQTSHFAAALAMRRCLLSVFPKMVFQHM